MSEDNVAIRLKGFIDKSGLSYSQFADQCGIPRPSLSQILSGRNKKISDVIVGQIHHAFPDLSVLWLLFGEGDMIVGKGIAENGAVSEAKNGAENSEITGDDASSNENLNLSGLEIATKAVQIAEQKQYKTAIKVGRLEDEIDKMRQNPRKVSHITVYYDDSTFETFYPAKEKK